jgi:hypothetical protein
MSSPRVASGRNGDDVSDGESESSPADSVRSRPGAANTCRWKTPEYHDQECLRYFDCPSHQVERILSDDVENNDDNNDEEEPVVCNLAAINISSQPAHSDQNPHETPSDEPLASPRSVLPAPASTSDYESAREDIQSPGVDARRVSQFSDSESHDSLDDDDDINNQSASPADSPEPPDSPTWIPESEAGEPRYTASAPPDHARLASVGSPIRGREDSYPSSPVDRAAQQGPTSPRQESRRASEFVLPRWQPDVEVTYCPICHSQFNIFVRKHHCRKCGRVVCNACSPHRIIIPHQYIVRPPGSEIPLPQSLLIDGLGGGYFDVNGLSGGERVRLCNPCVPDPNTAPPQSPVPTQAPSPRSTHHRSRSSFGNTLGPGQNPNRWSAVMPPNSAYTDPLRLYSPRTRSITMVSWFW